MEKEGNDMSSLSLPVNGMPGFAIQHNLLVLKAAAILAALLLADWLFYGHGVGISAVIFLVAISLIAALINRPKVAARQICLALVVLVAAFLPLVVETSLLSLAIGAIGAAYVVLTLVQPETRWAQRIGDAFALLIDCLWRATPDILQMKKSSPVNAMVGRQIGALAVWVLPLVLSVVFLFLFSQANPLIESWLGAIDIKAMFAQLSVPRILLWLAAISFTWPFIFIRQRRLNAEKSLKEISETIGVVAVDFPASNRLFNSASILRSLILFNVLFGVQTVLDAAYLWGGVELPQGMTHAAYAHRGAYPLIVTALLAAAFVIVAMKLNSEAERSPLTRALVFLWIAQNVLLVVSSMLRLDLYVQVYSLSYWRVAAFVWMVLICIGLILIVARMVLRRSTGWLISANLISLAAILYLCCFINFPRTIAEYNVEHSREMSEKGVVLDTSYLMSLGPQAILAIDRYLAKPSGFQPALPAYRRALINLPVYRRVLTNAHLQRMQDWRTWSYRDWELGLYLWANADLHP